MWTWRDLKMASQSCPWGAQQLCASQETGATRDCSSSLAMSCCWKAMPGGMALHVGCTYLNLSLSQPVILHGGGNKIVHVLNVDIVLDLYGPRVLLGFVLIEDVNKPNQSQAHPPGNSLRCKVFRYNVCMTAI